MTGIRLPGELEAGKRLRGAQLIADTREQKNEHILEWCERWKIPVVKRKLWLGDYALMLEERSLERKSVIERKHGIDELCVNFGSDYMRFERELLQARAFRTHLVLLVEDGSWEELLRHEYRSSYPPMELLRRICEMKVRYGLDLQFCSRADAPVMIWELLRADAWEEMLDGL